MDPLVARYAGSAARLRLNPEACQELRRIIDSDLALLKGASLQARLPNGEQITLTIEMVDVYDDAGVRQRGPWSQRVGIEHAYHPVIDLAVDAELLALRDELHHARDVPDYMVRQVLQHGLDDTEQFHRYTAEVRQRVEPLRNRVRGPERRREQTNQLIDAAVAEPILADQWRAALDELRQRYTTGAQLRGAATRLVGSGEEVAEQVQAIAGALWERWPDAVRVRAVPTGPERWRLFATVDTPAGYASDRLVAEVVSEVLGAPAVPWTRVLTADPVAGTAAYNDHVSADPDDEDEAVMVERVSDLIATLRAGQSRPAIDDVFEGPLESHPPRGNER